MTKIGSNFFSNTIAEKELRRLDRQLRLPGWNQETLKNSKVLIAGVGGLGTEIAKNLAMTGIGTIHLVDMDIIEHSNLNRQILFTDADEGEPKANIAAKNLKKINPFGKYIAHFGSLEELDPKIYEECDLYIAGLDSVKARKELIRRAVHNRKPLIDGGTGKWAGHAYTYLPGENACLECDPMREQEREDLAACTLVGIPRKKSHALLKGLLYFESKMNRQPNIKNLKEMMIMLEYSNELVERHFPTRSKFTLDDAIQQVDFHEPTIITINAVIASIQSQEALKLIHHLKDVQLGMLNDEYTIYNGLTGKFHYIKKPRNEKCTLCSKYATGLVKIKIPASTTLDMLRALIKKNGYTYDEEFPPSFYKIDASDMDILDDATTIKELKIQNGETLFMSGLTKDNKETDLYLKIYVK